VAESRLVRTAEYISVRNRQAFQGRGEEYFCRLQSIMYELFSDSMPPGDSPPEVIKENVPQLQRCAIIEIADFMACVQKRKECNPSKR